jgi:RHS repeat-associated protein
MTLQHSGAASGSSYTRIYNYDSASNKLLSTTVGTTTYSNAYDRRGNIVQMPHLSSITFNAANEMSSCNLGGGGNVYYQYSGGQRGRKTVINGSLTTQRIYMGNHEIYRSYTGSTLNVERRTVHVADDTGRIAMYEYVSGGGDSYAPVLSRYIYSNHLSTATLELDNNASIISYEEYHPYGTTAFQEMNAAINATAKRYRYVGKERDDESGFYYMGARYYAPWLGRWCALDPLESKYSPESPYNYCHNNPIALNDPSGMGPDEKKSEDKSISLAPPINYHVELDAYFQPHYVLEDVDINSSPNKQSSNIDSLNTSLTNQLFLNSVDDTLLDKRYEKEKAYETELFMKYSGIDKLKEKFKAGLDPQKMLEEQFKKIIGDDSGLALNAFKTVASKHNIEVLAGNENYKEGFVPNMGPETKMINDLSKLLAAGPHDDYNQFELMDAMQRSYKVVHNLLDHSRVGNKDNLNLTTAFVDEQTMANIKKNGINFRNDKMLMNTIEYSRYDSPNTGNYGEKYKYMLIFSRNSKGTTRNIYVMPITPDEKRFGF